MRKNKGKILSIFLIALSIISIGMNVYGHLGRTDSSGGHKDNKNKSGLGSYHYHCGGHPAHLHTNGVCPYSSSKNTTSSSSSSTKKTTTTVTSSVTATEIQINEEIESLKVGESKTLTATIKPSNTTNKNITWKSSDESIATVSSDGAIVAKKSGTVEISAATSNGKTSTMEINIKDELKAQNTTAIKTAAIINNNTDTNQEDSDSLGGGILALGLLGGGYLAFKKFKK